MGVGNLRECQECGEPKRVTEQWGTISIALCLRVSREQGGTIYMEYTVYYKSVNY